MRSVLHDCCNLARIPLVLLVCLCFIEMDVDFAELHRSVQTNGVLHVFSNPNGTSVWRRRHRLGMPRHNTSESPSIAFETPFDRWFHDEDLDGDDDLTLPNDDEQELVSANNKISSLGESKQDTSHLKGYLDMIKAGEATYGHKEMEGSKEVLEDYAKHPKNLRPNEAP